MRSSAILLIVTAFSGFAKAFPNWGCMAPDFVSSKYLDLSKYPSEGLPPLDNMVIGPDHPANSYMGCPTHCRSLQLLGSTPPGPIEGLEEFLEAARIFQEYSDLYNKIRVSAFRPRKGGELGECYCLDYKALQLSADAMVLGDGPNGDCFPEDFQLMELNIHRPTTIDRYYQLLSCVAVNPFDWSLGYPPDVDGSQAWDYVVSSPEKCILFCGMEYPKRVFAQPQPGSTEWECHCANIFDDLVPATCGPGVGRFYVFEDAPVPSEYARKRTLAARARDEAEFFTYRHCPRGLDACSIPGSESAYECLDTKTELEACGGCVDGYFDQGVINGTVGTDCTGLNGIALGGASCINGRCQVTKCRKGYRLEGGRCSKTFSFV